MSAPSLQTSLEPCLFDPRQNFFPVFFYVRPEAFENLAAEIEYFFEHSYYYYANPRNADAAHLRHGLAVYALSLVGIL